MKLQKTNVYSLCHYRNIQGDGRTRKQHVEVVRLWSDQIHQRRA